MRLLSLFFSAPKTCKPPPPPKRPLKIASNQRGPSSHQTPRSAHKFIGRTASHTAHSPSPFSAAVDQSSRPSSPLSCSGQSPSRHALDPPRLTLPKIHAQTTQSRAETQCIESRWCPLGPAWAQRDRFRPWPRISIASSLPSSSCRPEQRGQLQLLMLATTKMSIAGDRMRPPPCSVLTRSTNQKHRWRTAGAAAWGRASRSHHPSSISRAGRGGGCRVGSRTHRSSSSSRQRSRGPMAAEGSGRRACGWWWRPPLWPLSLRAAACP